MKLRLYKLKAWICETLSLWNSKIELDYEVIDSDDRFIVVRNEYFNNHNGEYATYEVARYCVGRGFFSNWWVFTSWDGSP